jgi:hypothetical protein
VNKQELADKLEITKIKLVDGTDFEIPRISLGKELKVYNRFAKMCKANCKDDFDIVAILSDDSSIDVIMDILNILFEKSKEWIEENIDTTEVMAFAIPFLVKRISKITNLMEVVIQSPLKNG